MHYLVKSLSTETSVLQLEKIKIENKKFIIGRKASSIELFELTENGDLISELEQMIFNEIIYFGVLNTTSSSDILVLLIRSSFEFLVWSSYLRRFVTLTSLPLVSEEQIRSRLPYKFLISPE
jgi:hypothetical protein